MPEPYPSKYDAAATGIFQGLNTSMNMIGQQRFYERQKLEDTRYNQTTAAAAEKLKTDRMIELHKVIAKLNDPNKALALAEDFARVTGYPEAQQAVDFLKSQGGFENAKGIIKKIEVGDYIGAYEDAGKYGIPVEGLKQHIEFLKSEEEKTSLQKAASAAANIPAQSYTTIPEEKLIPSPPPPPQGLFPDRFNLGGPPRELNATMPAYGLLNKRSLTPEQERLEAGINTGNKLFSEEIIKKGLTPDEIEVKLEQVSVPGNQIQNMYVHRNKKTGEETRRQPLGEPYPRNTETNTLSKQYVAHKAEAYKKETGKDASPEMLAKWIAEIITLGAEKHIQAATDKETRSNKTKGALERKKATEKLLFGVANLGGTINMETGVISKEGRLWNLFGEKDVTKDSPFSTLLQNYEIAMDEIDTAYGPEEEEKETPLVSAPIKQPLKTPVKTPVKTPPVKKKSLDAIMEGK